MLTFITLIGIFLFLHHSNSNEKKQEELAITLGVRIKDYPFVTVFPLGYFYTVIKPGMTLDDVHFIIRGYEKVLRCRDSAKDALYYKEVYYYFSPRDDEALRFQLFYDEQGRFLEFQGEDEDSRTIMTLGCEEGIIQNKAK